MRVFSRVKYVVVSVACMQFLIYVSLNYHLFYAPVDVTTQPPLRHYITTRVLNDNPNPSHNQKPHEDLSVNLEKSRAELPVNKSLHKPHTRLSVNRTTPLLAPLGPKLDLRVNIWKRSNIHPASTVVKAYEPLQLNKDIDDSRTRCEKNHSNTIIAYVPSAPGHNAERQRIRRTWGSIKIVDDVKIKLLFYIGNLRPPDVKYIGVIKNESRQYGDIIQDTAFDDSFRNLTLKGLSMFQWMVKYCPEPLTLMKIDDDTVVNPYKLVRYLKQNRHILSSKIMCAVNYHSPRIKDTKSKYYVSETQYNHTEYPPYCQGYIFFLPPKLIKMYLEKITPNQIIPIDDVVFTGFLREATNTSLHSINSLIIERYKNLNDYLKVLTYKKTNVAIANIKEERLHDLFWQLVHSNVPTNQT